MFEYQKRFDDKYSNSGNFERIRFLENYTLHNLKDIETQDI